MDRIYTTQDKLRIELITGVDITGATALKIKYKKENGDTGVFDATSSDDATGTIYYDIPADEYLTPGGTWVFWAFVTFADGRSAPGNPVRIKIFKEPS